MRIGSYRFSCQFTSQALLPPFKGSLLRGAFGHALKKTVCAQHRPSCVGCLLSEVCGYSFIFEVAPTAPEPAPRTAARPHPFIMLPPDSPQRSFTVAEPFNFGLRLFGRANDYLPHIVYAVEQMGKSGLGKGLDEGAGRFRLVSVKAADSVVYDGAAQILTAPQALPELILAPPGTTPLSALAVKLLTPAALQTRQPPARAPDLSMS